MPIGGLIAGLMVICSIFAIAWGIANDDVDHYRGLYYESEQKRKRLIEENYRLRKLNDSLLSRMDGDDLHG